MQVTFMFIKYLKHRMFQEMKLFHWCTFLIPPLFLVFFACTFDQGDDTKLEVERVDLSGDTISPWETLIFGFNLPIVDSNTIFTLNPDPGPVYNFKFNNTMDTLYFEITGRLSGNTLYQIGLNNDLEAENGSLILKDDLLFTFYTLPLENEPNNSKETADTLNDIIYGITEIKNDEDFFVIIDSSVNNVILINDKKKSGFQILNNNNDVLSTNEELGDTLIGNISSNNEWPLFIKVFSLVDSDSRYQLEVR